MDTEREQKRPTSVGVSSGGCRILERGVPVASRCREPHPLAAHPSLACDALNALVLV